MSPYVYRGKIHDLELPEPVYTEPVTIAKVAVFDPSLCGSTRGHKQHRKFSEPPCADCRAAYNTYYRDLTDRRRKGLVVHLGFRDDACGTLAGYKRHRYHKVELCEPCRAARRAYIREYNERRAAA